MPRTTPSASATRTVRARRTATIGRRISAGASLETTFYPPRRISGYMLNRRRPTLASAVVVFGALATVGAQTPAPATPSRIPSANGLIVGHVIDASSGKPIAGALVRLNPLTQPNGPVIPRPGEPAPPGVPIIQRAQSDANGGF